MGSVLPCVCTMELKHRRSQTTAIISIDSQLLEHCIAIWIVPMQCWNRLALVTLCYESRPQQKCIDTPLLLVNIPINY